MPPSLCHLSEARGRVQVTLNSGHVLTSAPGYVLFLDGLHNGRWQTVTIDPSDVETVAAGLRDMRERTQA